MTRFRTIEHSRNHSFSPAGLDFLTVKSPALQSRADVCVYESASLKNHSSAPITILLHGVYGSCWSWALSGGAHVALESMIEDGLAAPMLLVMPSDGLWGDGSGYVDHGEKNFERWIVEDVIALIRQTYSCVDERSPVSIAGLSMGGFGALRLGAKYPDVFNAFYGFSSITDFDQLRLFVEEPLETYNLKNRDDASVFEWMKTNKDRLPPFGFNCGVDDELIEFNRKLHKDLLDLNINHEYNEYRGGHTWEYWHKHLSDALAFFKHTPQ
ncbi:MAG: alpha/beta hydrolase-fold protein [Candidatus Hinthialibacter antarcticus]|nr:alpha/beta hydrolase-fold protein [Candidatus Hinthialibacter antarcticus]